MIVQQLLKTIRTGGAAGDDAAWQLGILFELALLKWPIPEQRQKTQDLLPREYREVKLSREDVKHAAFLLLEYIGGLENPSAQLLNTLKKANDDRALPLWKKLLLEHMKDPDKRDIAYHALNAITISDDQAFVVPLVKLAAREAVGDVKELADNIIEVYPSLFQDKT